jgi:hypothetical protein
VLQSLHRIGIVINSWCDIRKDFTDLTNIDVDVNEENYFLLGLRFVCVSHTNCDEHLSAGSLKKYQTCYNTKFVGPMAIKDKSIKFWFNLNENWMRY